LKKSRVRIPEKPLTAKFARKSREGRKEEQSQDFSLRSLRIFFAGFAVKGFPPIYRIWV
jgi:hypothetical protein